MSSTVIGTNAASVRQCVETSSVLRSMHVILALNRAWQSANHLDVLRRMPGSNKYHDSESAEVSREANKGKPQIGPKSLFATRQPRPARLTASYVYRSHDDYPRHSGSWKTSEKSLLCGPGPSASVKKVDGQVGCHIGIS